MLIIIGIMLCIIVLIIANAKNNSAKDNLLRCKLVSKPVKYVKLIIKDGIIELPKTDIQDTYLNSYDEIVIDIDSVRYKTNLNIYSYNDDDTDYNY